MKEAIVVEYDDNKACDPVKKEDLLDEEKDSCNGFCECQAYRMARNPWTHFWISLTISIALSAIALVIGEFSVSANTGGWTSRGTHISYRPTQLLLTQRNMDYLFYGG